MNETKNILFVNPWIYDFAAYDMWMKPLALLYYAAIFRNWGFGVELIDCLEGVLTPGLRKMESDYGCRKFVKEEVEKPVALGSIPRVYSKYGMTFDDFRMHLEDKKEPDWILVGSMMTYWYPGVFKAISVLKERFPKAKVALAGKYAEICLEHAVRNSGADAVITERGFSSAASKILRLMESEDRILSDFQRSDFPYPAFDLYGNLRYVCIATSIGCPFKCSYCHTPVAGRPFVCRGNESVIDEMEYWHKEFGVKNFAFYDDALNYKSQERLMPVLRGLIARSLDVNLHAPNAMSARWIDSELAELMMQSGFKTVRLGLETADESVQKRIGAKVFRNEFERAASCLRDAGFSHENLGAYLLTGMPDQTPESLIDDVDYVFGCGVRPYLAEYSPIPGTAMFKEAKKLSRFDIESEPLFHNNSILPLQSEKFSMADLNYVKIYLREKLKVD